jgi:hypothetical protein
MDARRASSAATRGAPAEAASGFSGRSKEGSWGSSDTVLGVSAKCRAKTRAHRRPPAQSSGRRPQKQRTLDFMTADERMARMTLHAIYPLYLAKIEKKGRSKAELDEILQWITQLDADGLATVQAEKWTFQELFDRLELHPNASLITGVICGYRVENIENPVSQKVRYLDKIVDELAKGRAVEKIMRERLS